MRTLAAWTIDRAFRWRTVFVVGVNLALFTIAYTLAYELRFDFRIPPGYQRVLRDTLPVLLLVKAAVFHRYSLHRGLWRYVSISDLQRIIKASLVSSLVLVAVAFLAFRTRGIPRSVIGIDFFLTVLFTGGLRFAVRMFRESYRPQVRGERERRVLIVGAGDAGEQTLREIRQNGGLGLVPVGLVDDDPRKIGGSIHGISILGSTEDLGEYVRRHRVEEVLIAIPSAKGTVIRGIVERCEATNVRFKILPAVGDLIAGRVSVRQFREVQIEDLLGREHVQLDVGRLKDEICGQTILITGAGGSIGRELARQVLGFGPRRLLMLDRAENALFSIDRELREKGPNGERVVPIVGDVQDRGLLEEMFARWRPSLVYHAAAYKHVPLMETSVLEAVRNNVFGSRTVMDVARGFGVDRFVLVSTDKAVRPTNVMGATKRLAELLMLERGGSAGTKFVAVRFGNVLGSEGSVLPIFREQLRAGGPLTVTDPQATRYFMTIPEAVQLVMQAGAMGHGGEIFVLDMGEPMRIDDLAHRLVTLAGSVPGRDVEIVYTGLRPGERLHEELVAPEESVLQTAHEKIRILAGTCVNAALLRDGMKELERCAVGRDADRLRDVLMDLVSGPGEERTRVIAFPAS